MSALGPSFHEHTSTCPFFQLFWEPMKWIHVLFSVTYVTLSSFPGGSAVKNLPVDVGDVVSIPGWGRYTGEGNGNPLQYSCLGNSMDKGVWRATAHGSQRVGHNSATEKQ